MKGKYIKDLVKNEQLSEEKFVMRSFKKNQTKSGDEYYRFELGDKTGSVAANMWKDNIQNCDEEGLKEGCIVVVYGKVEEFKGSLQINLHAIKVCADYDAEDFVTVSDRDPEDMWNDFKKHVASIDDPDYFELVTRVFKDEKLKETYRQHPAAERLHHAFKYGLLEHVMEILDMAEVMFKYYPEANKSLVKTGIIFHDIGKIYELEDHETSYTKSEIGNLLGHIVLSCEIVQSYAGEEFPIPKLMKLKHVILSHHGVLEYGSPVVPMTIEAVIVSQLDDASAQTRQYQRIIRENAGKEDAFTQRDGILGTKIYLK